MAKKILIIAGEKNLARFISLELQKKDFLVDVASSGQDALVLAHETDYDLILLNFVLVDMSGADFAERLAQFKPASVIITIAETEDAKFHQDEMNRYSVAYVVKPFVMPDLITHIEAIFRGRDFIDQHCSQMKLPATYRDLQVNMKNHTVQRGDELINLTRREFDLLATLMNATGVLTRDQILERVWKYESATETNIVDVYIRYLRGKLDLPNKESYIKTVRGVGYTMRA